MGGGTRRRRFQRDGESDDRSVLNPRSILGAFVIDSGYRPDVSPRISVSAESFAE